MNANIERLITRIIEGSETLKAEKTCIEKDTVPAYAQSVETMAAFGYEWIPATDPRSKTHKNVERALIAYLNKCTEEEIEESWDETLNAYRDRRGRCRLRLRQPGRLQLNTRAQGVG